MAPADETGDEASDDRYESPYLEINERVDVGEALAELRSQLDRLPEYRYAWRWSCAALHASVQAAIVVSIAGAAKIGAMRVKDQAKWMAAYDEGRWSDLPDERSDDFLPLYRRMKEQLAFSPGDDVDLAVERLHRLRNLLGHIRPTSLLVHPADLVEMTAACLRVVRFLLIEHGEMWWLYSSEQELVETELAQIDESVLRLRKLYCTL